MRTIALAMFLILGLARASASPVTGTWEGSREGSKAAVLTITEKDGALTGSVVLYVIRDNGDGSKNGSPTPALPIGNVNWDGRVLHFTVSRPDGVALPFDLRMTADDNAVLQRRGSSDPDESVRMIRRK